MNLKILIKSFIERYFVKFPNYKIWQCPSMDKYPYGNGCQRLKGHAGNHQGWNGESW